MDSVELNAVAALSSAVAESMDKAGPSKSDPESKSGRDKIMEYNLTPADMTIGGRKAFLQHMVENLPSAMRNRVTALKYNQMEQIKISEQFFREVYALEQRYYMESCSLYDARRDIVSGSVEPPTLKPYWHEEADEQVEQIRSSAQFQDLVSQIPRMPENAPGIPKFWLTVFRSVALISDMIQDHDEPLLECLHDVRIRYDPDSYTIEFVFQPNDYLHTSSLLLTKRYFLRHEADKYYPFTFEGPEIIRCEGCNILWRDGANLTLQTVEYKRQRKTGRPVTKVMPRESFFHFFTPTQTTDLAMADEKTKIVLSSDFEVGYLLRTQIVPKAVLFYTGDVIDNGPDDMSGEQPTTSSSQESDGEMPCISSSSYKS